MERYRPSGAAGRTLDPSAWGRGCPGGVARSGAWPRARVHCRRRGRAGWRAAGPQWRGVPVARRAEGHGSLFGPGRSQRRRPVRLRLRLGTRDQNSFCGADAAPAGLSGKVAPGAAPRLPRPRPAMAAAARTARGRVGSARREAAAAPHSAAGLRRRVGPRV